MVEQLRLAKLPCSASADSFLDYGQNAILSTGNFLCSAATANSTMDFSTNPMEDGVVDSPPSRATHLPKSCSPSPLRPTHPLTSRMSPSPSKRVLHKKLYEDVGPPTTMTTRTSSVPTEPMQEKLHVSSLVPSLLPPRVRNLGVRKTKTHDGVLRSRCALALLSASDRKFIQLQRLQAVREYKKKDNGYSRGPEILMAIERIKSKSHM